MTPLLSKLNTSAGHQESKRDERQIISDVQIIDEDSRVSLSQISVLPLTHSIFINSAKRKIIYKLQD